MSNQDHATTHAHYLNLRIQAEVENQAALEELRAAHEARMREPIEASTKRIRAMIEHYLSTS